MTPGGPFPPQSERVFPLLTLSGQSSEIINPGYCLTRDSSPALTFSVQTPLQRAALEAWAQGLPDASAEAKHRGTGPLEPRLQLGFYSEQERVTEGRAAPANTHPDDLLCNTGLPILNHAHPSARFTQRRALFYPLGWLRTRPPDGCSKPSRATSLSPMLGPPSHSSQGLREDVCSREM